MPGRRRLAQAGAGCGDVTDVTVERSIYGVQLKYERNQEIPNQK